jgi:hypothetical protein
MSLSRNVLEDLLQRAEADLTAWVDVLSKSGVPRDRFRRHPTWRSLNARRSQIQRRLDRVSKIEANDAEVARRKAENEAASAG